jgi:phosphate transport system permease protein
VSFTGHARKRATSKKVRIAERVARIAITVGGIGTIVAVATICVFLVWVVLPLFRDGTIGAPRAAALAGAETRPAAGAPLTLAVDEYRALAWTVDAAGVVEVRRLDDGTIVDRHDLFPGDATAWAFGIGDGRAAFGFADGSTREASVDFVSELVDLANVSEAHRGLAPGAVATFERAVIVRLPDGQFRRQAVTARIDEPVVTGSKAAVRLLDQAVSEGRELFCVLRADDSLVMEEIVRRKNLLTDEEKVDVAEAKLPYRKREGAGEPLFLRISERGDQVYLAWADGHLARFDCRNLEKPVLSEELDLVPESSVTLTCLGFMNGRTTLIAGDSAGNVRGWFGTKPPDTPNPDGIVMRMAHEFPPHAAAVTACSTSTRTRLFVTGDAGGGVRVAQMTTEKIIAEASVPGAAPVLSVRIAPKNDGIVALTAGRLAAFDFDGAHSGVSLRSIVLPVWYEGATGPSHVWQSGGGSDDYEPKLGLMPLVFGTLKATFYSLLFSVPIALLAALYTSEFLHPRTRALVKPAIEMMASLPSVVLGFLAALVLAPLVERIVPSVLLAFVAVPATFVAGAYLWQLLPFQVATRLGGGVRFLAIACMLPLGIALSALLGPGFERVFFHGDLKLWLDGQIRGAVGGWTLLLLPLSAVVVVFLFGKFVSPKLLKASAGWSHTRSAVVDVGKLVAGAVLTVLLAWAVGALFDAAALDPRGGLFGTYVQRNAMIVGFVMGFAVIPIIYTLSEDALASVPVHLRSASLGCGATRWQTATRIVLPTALSGIFSAVMVGLGRAVGETMVVLMAAGNTPVLDWNMFSGFRTLSANIAVELPEAVQGSTHYRVLFLAALTLFGITFLLNTAAEAVRLRFRKRAFQL